MKEHYAGLKSSIMITLGNKMRNLDENPSYKQGFADAMEIIESSLSVEVDPIRYTETRLHFLLKNKWDLNTQYGKGRRDAFKTALNDLIYMVIYEI